MIIDIHQLSYYYNPLQIKNTNQLKNCTFAINNEKVFHFGIFSHKKNKLCMKGDQASTCNFINELGPLQDCISALRLVNIYIT